MDSLLRARGPYAAGSDVVPWARLALIVLAGGFVYGAAMGLFGVRGLQALYSAAKVPVLLGAATIVCLPNFYVVNTLLGLRDDFGAACRAIFAAQATMAVTLAAFAPITLLSYASSDDYDFAILFNGLAFAVGTGAAQFTMQRHYRELIARNPRHRIGRVAWGVLYVFVAIQLAWVLRPFIGSLRAPTQFFRKDAWSNAYVVVFEMLGEFVSGR
ncbi:MAG: hypothetical protein K8T90_14935 [Planctomycetes bacterium]|nr:hypothetical protein [Planctomycetota bacterium]